jgi:hypothetical protein
MLKDGYGETAQNNLISSTVSIGPAKVRRRTTASIRPIAGALIMSETQYQTFTSFFLADIKSGSLPFTFPDPHAGADLLVRLHQPPTASPIGICWRVDISLEVLP